MFFQLVIGQRHWHNQHTQPSNNCWQILYDRHTFNGQACNQIVYPTRWINLFNKFNLCIYIRNIIWIELHEHIGHDAPTRFIDVLHDYGLWFWWMFFLCSLNFQHVTIYAMYKRWVVNVQYVFCIVPMLAINKLNYNLSLLHASLFTWNCFEHIHMQMHNW